MKKFFSLILSFVFPVLLANCGSGNSTGTFADSNRIAIDSTNNRLFVTQPRGEIFVFTADSLEALGEQPVVNEDRLTSINALLPEIIADLKVFANGSTTRLFLRGLFSDDNGDFVTNRIRVLDFDGTSFAEAAFSPVILSDGDDGTTDSDNSFVAMLVDPTNASLYITDATQGLLYALDVTDGSTVTGPIAITGNPQGLSLSDNRLYVCNSSVTDAEQIVTVVNLADFSTTAIDLDMPCHKISVASGTGGTTLVAKHSTSQTVQINSVDTTTFATATAIASATTGIANGLLTSGAGISSGVKSLLSTSLNGTVYGYLTEQDGTIRMLQFAADLSSFTLTDIPTTTTDITESTLFESGGNGVLAYFVSNNGFVLSIGVGGTDVEITN